MNQSPHYPAASSKSYKNNTQSIQVYGKVPPQHLELEEYVLGAMLMEESKTEIATEMIPSPEVFYKESHRIIYEAILELKSKGITVDMLTVHDMLVRQGEIERIGGAYTLTKLTGDVSSTGMTESHILILLEDYARRECIKIAGDLISKSYDMTEGVFDNMEEAEKSLFELTSRDFGKDAVHISEEILPIMDDILTKRQNKIEFTGVPTGFSYLDDLTGGWQKTDLVILAARPSVGKTALALNFALNAALSDFNKSSVVVFSLEMSSSQLVKRLMSNISRVPLDSIRNPVKLQETQIAGLNQYNNELFKAPIYIDDNSSISVMEMKGKCRRLKKKRDIGLIIIDYLQLMNGGRIYRGNREQEISSISRELKHLAKELDVPVIALSQLSRAVESRSDKKPNLSDLRESGAIEQDADLVAFIYRPVKEQLERAPDLNNAVILSIAKHRNGNLDDMPLYKNLSIQRFSDEPFIEDSGNETPVNHYAGMNNRQITNSVSITPIKTEEEDLPF